MTDSTSNDWDADYRTDPRPTDALLEIARTSDLDDDNTPADAWKAIGALQHRLPKIFPTICEMSKCSSSITRANAASIFGQKCVKDPVLGAEGVAELTRILSTEENPEVIDSAVSALLHLREFNTLPLVLKYQFHSYWKIRWSIAVGLDGETDSEIECLLRYSEDPEVSVRDWGTMKLGNCKRDSETIRQALGARLADEDEATRGEAMVGLANRIDPRVIEALSKEFAIYFSGETKTNELFALRAAEILVKRRVELGPEWTRLLKQFDEAQYFRDWLPDYKWS